jgi:Holliday junction resolvasome RuvABC ATP-dependent DNA helicase subunit
LNRAIFDVLSEAMLEQGRDVSQCPTFIPIADFKTVVQERSCEKEFDYYSLRGKLSVYVLCVEDFVLAAVLAPKEFKKFLSFIVEEGTRTSFFFGDFSLATVAFAALSRDFETVLNIRDFDARRIEIDEAGILKSAFEADGVSVPDGTRLALGIAWHAFRRMRRDESLDAVMRNFISKSEFSASVENGARVLTDASFAWVSVGAKDAQTASAPDARPASMRELAGLTGMESVKTEIARFAAHAAVSSAKAAAGMTVDPINLSFLFLGNPGTGKTTVARILARLLKDLGLLKRGHLVTANRGTLIGEYIGQTAPLVTETFMSAIDGVLFVDEAYALHDSDKSMDSYGREAINTLTLLMSEFAGRIAVIFAGYEDEMNDMFETVNPGLRDRFTCKVKFADYNEDELWQIFLGRTNAAGLALEDGADEILKGEIARLYANRDRRFSNARAMNNLFQSLVNIQEARLAEMVYSNAGTPKDALALLSADDCAKLAESMAKQSSAPQTRLIGFA